MDIVYFIKTDPENDTEELRYSLRSLRHIPHGRVFLVGEKPGWVKGIEFIEVLPSKGKYENVRKSLLKAINYEDISDDFILMNDDFFIMRPISQLPVLHLGPIDKVLEEYRSRYSQGSSYISNLAKENERLKKEGFRLPLCYDLHAPMQINKHKATELFRNNKCLIHIFRTHYGNHTNTEGALVKDVKVFVDPIHNDPQYNENPMKYLTSQTFLSATGGSFARALVGDFIRTTFPDKSEYEEY